MAVKVYTLSDLHVDHADNFTHLLSLQAADYHDSAIIVPGDVTDDLHKLERLLRHFRQIFAEVFFVPGNHEMWIRGRLKGQYDSLDKFDMILSMCQRLGVHTQPMKLGSGEGAVWVVPMFSWYTKAEDGEDTLYRAKPGNDQTEMLWVDNHCCDWSSLTADKRVVDHFLEMNEPVLNQSYDAPVISFSHFLPLKELVFPIGWFDKPRPNFVDPMPKFNFTRVAGSSLLNQQIQQLGSTMHIHGHQHRNRHRDIDGVTYVSHCLAYPKERQSGHWHGTDKPKLVWHDGKVTVSEPF